jgi:hypothetical protein
LFGKVWDFALTEDDMKEFDKMNVGWRHLLWAETSMHPDYPFKDCLPADYKWVLLLTTTVSVSWTLCKEVPVSEEKYSLDRQSLKTKLQKDFLGDGSLG